MIHHCQINPAEHRAIASGPHSRHHAHRIVRARGAWLAIPASIALILSLARSLGAQAPAPPAAPDSARAQLYARSWYADRRAFNVGDIIKVDVDEYALATANKDDNSEASRGRKMDMGISPPSMGAADAAMGPIDGSVSTSDRGSSRRRGDARRGTRYLGQITVRVIAVTPEGMLQVKGQKVVDVDGNKQEMMLSGIVRPQDVSSEDVVSSESVADAQLSYKSKGSLGKPKNGILTKIVGLLWP